MKFLNTIVIATLYLAHLVAPRLLRSEEGINETFAEELLGITAVCDDTCFPDKTWCCNCGTPKKCYEYKGRMLDAYKQGTASNYVCWERKEHVDTSGVCWTKKKDWYINCKKCYAKKVAVDCPVDMGCNPPPSIPYYSDDCDNCYKLSDLKSGGNVKFYSEACWEKMKTCPNHSRQTNWMLRNGFWYEKRGYPCDGTCYLTRGAECTDADWRC